MLYDLLPISDLTFLYSAVIRATGLTTVVVSKLVEAVPSSRPVAGAVPSSRAGAGAAANSRAVAKGGSLRRLQMSWIKTWKLPRGAHQNRLIAMMVLPFMSLLEDCGVAVCAVLFSRSIEHLFKKGGKSCYMIFC